MSRHEEDLAYQHVERAKRYRYHYAVTVLTRQQDAEVAAALAITRKVRAHILQSKYEFEEQKFNERMERIRQRFQAASEAAE